jgi:hypothetical protein
MKKNPINLLMTCTAAVLITFTACKKPVEQQPTPSETATHSDDQMQFTAEMDAVTDEANDIIRDNASFNFRNSTNTICDGTYSVDTNAAVKTITITYNGGDCSGRNRTRTGSVVLSMAKDVRWADAGAQLTITYNNVTVTRNSDQKSITLNGSAVITNVTGGTIIGLPNSGSMVHRINSDGMTVKFADGTSRTWMVAKQRDFSYNNGIVISTSGTHSEGSLSQISEWGVNRGGQAFTTVIAEPLVITQECYFRVTSGRIEYNTDTKLAITFGLDMYGVPTNCPGLTGNYYFKAEFTDLRSITHTLIWPY